MHSWLACWERESVEVVITLFEAGWSHAQSWSWSESQLVNVNKTGNDLDRLPVVESLFITYSFVFCH